ncbi:MAG: rRNA adenine N-6-methyltransferase family protein [Capnocytophaga sp.]|nr:rRNA adenine N-6-methyltransferase family protein [Capnocytophaga sp.]
MNTQQGHWLLAKMGKKVLRPGGKELTQKMIDGLAITNDDEVVEFAPGLGFTAQMTLAKNPKSYIGVELDTEAAEKLRKKFAKDNVQIINKNAAETEFPEQVATKVYGEAMLTMQADHRKAEIIREAHRILKSNGLYAIHELGLKPDNIEAETKATIQRELAQAIKVNARPLTISEWTKIIEDEGFKVIKVETNPMHLLEKKRMIQDEGILRTLKINFNMLINPDARKRIQAMRKVFRTYQNNLNAVAIIAQKI